MTAFKRITGVLIDLSGTLHVEDVAIPGAVEALDRLRKSSVRIRFVSNTTKESTNSLHARLTSLGFNINRSEIFTSLTAARQYAEQKQLRPLLLLEEDSKSDFIGISEDEPNSVMIGLAPSKFNYEYMNRAFQLLMNGAQLIAIHKGRYYQRKDGLALGPGAFVTGLEMAADVKATVIGKPEPTFFMQALMALECPANEAVMIGDDVRDDVHGAMNAGLNAILVKTGKYRDGDVTKISPPPNLVCSSFVTAVDFILQQLNTLDHHE